MKLKPFVLAVIASAISVCQIFFILIVSVPIAWNSSESNLNKVKLSVQSEALTSEPIEKLEDKFLNASCEEIIDINRRNECILSQINQDLSAEKGVDIGARQVKNENFSRRNEPPSRIGSVFQLFEQPMFIVIVSIILLSGNISNYCFMGHLTGEKTLLNRFHAWAIETPPVAGVCGTLYSLIVYLANINEASGTDGFLQAFSFAAITTLLGGSMSIFNHLVISLSTPKR